MLTIISVMWSSTLPKSLKTWLAAELAVAIASGGKVLGRFQTRASGPVLVFTAEDKPPEMRVRLDGIASARGLRVPDLPLRYIDMPQLRLDDAPQIRRLHKTIAAVRPLMIILDPYVRLVLGVDENSSAEVSRVLGALRTIQREHNVAVVLVHHMRKTPSAHPSQQLRGSGDFGAWLDSGLYLTLRGDHVVLTVEHRSAPSSGPFLLRLQLRDPTHLVLFDREIASAATAGEPLHLEILDALRSAARAMTTVEIRAALRVRKATLLKALNALAAQHLVKQQRLGWMLVLPGEEGSQ